MPLPNSDTLTVYFGTTVCSVTQETFKLWLRDPQNKNFILYENNQQIFSRIDGIETRYNGKTGFPMYEFHLGWKNSLLRGHVISPNGKTQLDVGQFSSEEIDRIRFGRNYNSVLIKSVE